MAGGGTGSGIDAEDLATAPANLHADREKAAIATAAGNGTAAAAAAEVAVGSAEAKAGTEAEEGSTATAAAENEPAAEQVAGVVADILVSGCGRMDINGTYSADGLRDGVPCYKKAGGSFTIERDTDTTGDEPVGAARPACRASGWAAASLAPRSAHDARLRRCRSGASASSTGMIATASSSRTPASRRARAGPSARFASGRLLCSTAAANRRWAGGGRWVYFKGWVARLPRGGGAAAQRGWKV